MVGQPMRDTAIVGIGATEFSKASGRSELRLALEAISAAMLDAGLPLHTVDALTTSTMDRNDEIEVARNLGLSDLKFFARAPFGGGGACAGVVHASLAVASGQADVAVAYRAMNERSGVRFGTVMTKMPRDTAADSIRYSWSIPFGLSTPATYAALLYRRYMSQFGAGEEHLARLAVQNRQYASTNPAAWYYGRPLTTEQYYDSRVVSEPLRVPDCCQESDGAVALVITPLDRARDLPSTAVHIAAGAQGVGVRQSVLASLYRDDITVLEETRVMGRSLWQRAGMGPQDIDVAILYDHFAPTVLMQLEALGFCGLGEGWQMLDSGELGPGGTLPVNTHGGMIGEAYIHGYNNVAEAVRQIRGTAANQVDDVNHVLVTGGPMTGTSGLILAKAP